MASVGAGGGDLIIRVNDMMALDRCPEWTDARTAAFFGPSGKKTVSEFAASVGVEGITEEELYWGLVGFMTVRMRRRWCVAMLSRALKKYQNTKVQQAVGKMRDFLSRVPTKNERIQALKKARDDERLERAAFGFEVNKRTRFLRAVVYLMRQSNMRDETLKITRLLLSEHPGFGYADLLPILAKFIENKGG